MEGIKNFLPLKLKYVLNVMRMVGIEPTTSILSVWRSTTELHAQYIIYLLYVSRNAVIDNISSVFYFMHHQKSIQVFCKILE